MAKPRKTLNLRIPPYSSPRNLWRKKIHDLATQEAVKCCITYSKKDKIQIDLRLYLDEPALLKHDVDNRLKDIMDALQGRAGGPKKNRILEPIIPNDSQVYRVTVEKLPMPKQSEGYGHLKVSKYKPSRKKS